MEEFEVTTPRLRLRPQVTSDAADGYRLQADPAVRRFQSLPPPGPMEAFVEEYAGGAQLWSQGQAYYFVIEAQENQQYLGFVGVRFWNHPMKANLGYALRPEFWGQGLMTEAVATASYLAFEDCHAARVDASVRAGNLGSRRVLEKCGFRCDGTLRCHTLADGAWHDEWIMTLTRDDWEAAGRPGAPETRRGQLGK